MKKSNLIKLMIIGSVGFVLALPFIIQRIFLKEVTDMVTFIATKIEEATDISIEKGIAKYDAYFKGRARQKLYGKYQDDVNTVLLTDADENHPYDKVIQTY